MLDMIIRVQRIGLQAMSVYQPLASAFLKSADSARLETWTAQAGRPAGRGEVRNSNEEQVIGVGEEVLNVATRMVPGKVTTIRRFVVQTPVQQDVTLHTETVVLERRKPMQSSNNEVLTEVTVEMSDFNEVPVVSKAVHLVEEVLLRKEITARTETIRDTVRRDKLEIERPSNMPAVFQAASKPDDKKNEASAAPRADNKVAEHKRI